MIDRFGNSIRVGWSDFQLVWLEAAMRLPPPERQAAFQDIAELTGRQLRSVRNKAYEVYAAYLDRKALLMAQQRRMSYRPALAPSCIAPPSKAKLMAGRAR